MINCLRGTHNPSVRGSSSRGPTNIDQYNEVLTDLDMLKINSQHLLFGWLLFFSPMSINAQDRPPIDVHSLGPQVGEAVPEFNLPDQSGQMRTLESIKGPNGAMLLFHRSADW